MSTLTKVCIIVLALLCVLAVPIFITVANLVPNYRAAYEAEKKQKELTQQQDRVSQAALVNERSIKERDAAAYLATIAGLKKGETGLAATIKQGELQIIKLQTDITAHADLVAKAQAQLGAAQQMNEKLVAQINSQRDLIGQMNVDMLALRKAKEEAENASARDTAVLRSVREELAEAAGKIRKLEATIADLQRGGKGGAVQDVAADKPTIKGTVTSVQGNLVSINIGRAQGITKDMVLVVYRNAEYIGKLRIDMVELDHAAGVVEDKKHTPQIYDNVTTRVP